MRCRVQQACPVVVSATMRPTHDARTWALVDGNDHQIDRITAEAKASDVPVAITIDSSTVLEYIWKATWCLFPEADPVAETQSQSNPRRKGHPVRLVGE